MAEEAADSDDTAQLRRLLPTCRCPRLAADSALVRQARSRGPAKGTRRRASGTRSCAPAVTLPDGNIASARQNRLRSQYNAALHMLMHGSPFVFLPVREQLRGMFPHRQQPLSRPLDAVFQPLVLVHRPANQYTIDTLAERLHRSRIERGEVGEPATNDRVNLFSYGIQRQVRAPMQFSRDYLPADPRDLARTASPPAEARSMPRRRLRTARSHTRSSIACISPECRSP